MPERRLTTCRGVLAFDDAVGLELAVGPGHGASGETEIDLDRFPEACPYDWDTIMNQEFRR